MVEMFSTCFNACMNMSDDGLSHPFKNPMMIANGFTGIYYALVKFPFICNFSCNKLGLLSVG